MSVSYIAYSRHIRLLEILKRSGFSRIDELSQLLGVSAVTIRRDLDYLSRNGFLERRRGGALISSANTLMQTEQDFFTKGDRFTKEKEAIARKAQEFISHDDIIFLNSGSTSLHFLKALRNNNIRVFTNNAWAVTCHYNPSTELVVLGGEYRSQSRSFVGLMTLEAIKNVICDKTFLGTNGINLEKGLTTAVQQECSINRAMIENTQGEVFVLADSSKIGHISNFISASLNTIHVLITDAGCTREHKEGFENQGLRVVIADDSHPRSGTA